MMVFIYQKVATVELRKKVSCHAVADKLLVAWSPGELWQLETKNLDH